MTRMLIIQPYIPEYRVAFFQGLRQRLAPAGIDVVVAAGRPSAPLQMRDDDRSQAVADVLLRDRSVSVFGRGIHSRRVSSILRSCRPELVVVEQALKNLESYPLLARSKLKLGPRVAMWGHGRSFSTRQSRIESALKQWLTRQADWFFAYTNEGAKTIRLGGFAQSRITVVANSVDSAEIRAHTANVGEKSLREFMFRHGLSPGLIALFIGGIDDQKGIPFLIRVAEKIEKQIPNFRLLIAGAGGAVDYVLKAEAGGAPIRYLGRVEGEIKALALRACDLLMVPRWVGLVAVDSLAAGRPVITTRHPSHSPEFEYLRDGENALVTEDNEDAYANAVCGLLRDPVKLHALQTSAFLDGAHFTIDQMIENFAIGVEKWRHS